MAEAKPASTPLQNLQAAVKEVENRSAQPCRFSLFHEFSAKETILMSLPTIIEYRSIDS